MDCGPHPRPVPCIRCPSISLPVHGSDGPYRGRYDDPTLRDWARRFLAWRGAGLDAYCYFDNDEAGHAARDALRLVGMIADEGS